MPRKKPYEDPTDDGNSPHHHTGKPCIEQGCDKPAGTAWSPFWCQACNAARIKRIDRGFKNARSRPEDAIAELAALIKKSGGSVREHHPVTVSPLEVPPQDTTAPAADD